MQEVEEREFCKQPTFLVHLALLVGTFMVLLLMDVDVGPQRVTESLEQAAQRQKRATVLRWIAGALAGYSVAGILFGLYGPKKR